ncbi:hypothetical protein [Phytohabitans suffuscus]|uniref:hypothetical protein n=1 Tax=Phytohabitans suffuscus TaxID=624315 RepID=UPI001567696B|nr:hypothetical protein [Phytohabitans suffuscus]
MGVRSVVVDGGGYVGSLHAVLGTETGHGEDLLLALAASGRDLNLGVDGEVRDLSCGFQIGSQVEVEITLRADELRQREHNLCHVQSFQIHVTRQD